MSSRSAGHASPGSRTHALDTPGDGPPGPPHGARSYWHSSAAAGITSSSPPHPHTQRHIHARHSLTHSQHTHKLIQRITERAESKCRSVVLVAVLDARAAGLLAARVAARVERVLGGALAGGAAGGAEDRPPGRQRLPALGALVVGLTFVSLHVRPEVAGEGKLLVADLACVGLVTCVEEQVVLEVGQLGEAARTDVALEGPGARVDELVRLEVSGGGERLGAKTALVGLFVSSSYRRAARICF